MARRLMLVAAAVGLLGILLANVGLSWAGPNTTSKSPSGSWGRNLWGDDSEARAAGKAGPQSHEGGHSFTVRTRETHFKFINVDGPRFTPGDYFLFRERVFRSGRQVGVDNGQCTANFPLRQQRAAFLCEVSFTFFGRGEIMTEGHVLFGPATTTLTLPITGGTGHFQNVRGEIHVGGETQTVITFHLIP